MSPDDRRAEQAIRDRLTTSPSGFDLGELGSPSETGDAETFRRAARRLVAAGTAELLQGGRVVDPSSAKGPVRVRSRRHP